MAKKCPKCQTENPDTATFCADCGTQLPSPRDIEVTETLEIPTEELTTGSTFAGRYQVIEEMGRGGMGRVYKVLDKEINEKIALKLIKPEIASDKKTIERFRNELITARMIAHRNVCRMYDLNREKDNYYITMEYVPGEDLKSSMKRLGRLPIGKSISIAKQICDGLAEAHSLRVIHRDLKPSNIMIDDNGNARIMDFGIARILRGKGITDSGVMIGTPEYMSPEQVEGKEADKRSDLYSLGVILFEMVTGSIPFEGDSSFSVALKHKSEFPQDPRNINAQIPESLSRLILKCLQKPREQRYQSAKELRSKLQEIEEGIPETERVTPKIKPSTQKEITVKLSLKKLVIPVFILISLAVVIVLSIFLLKTLTSKKSASPTHTQLTFTGKVSYPAISPDGNFLAYVESEKIFEQKVMVLDRLNGQTIEVFNAKSCAHLKWLPNSSELSFLAFPKDDNGVYSYVVPRLGGSVRRLPHTPVMSWSPDGTQYTWTKRTADDISLVDRSSGDFQRIPFQATFKWFVSDDWSPLDNFLLILTIDKDSRYSIWTISLDGKNQNKVVEESAEILSPQWSPKGDSIYYFRGRADDKELWKVQISTSTGKATKSPELVLGGLQAGNVISLANDSRKLVYTREVSYSNIWMMTLEEPGDESSVKVKQLTTGTSRYGIPRFSPDGTCIAFSMRKGGSKNIYIMPLESGEPRQVTYLNSQNSSAAWSPDGKEIAFGSNEGGTMSVWKVSTEGGNLHRFAKTKLSETGYVSWEPGDSILYHKPGNRNFILLNPKTEEESPLVEDEMVGWMFTPYWSPDGKKVAVSWNRIDRKGGGAWIITLEDSTQKLVKEGNVYPVGWTPDGKWIYIAPNIQGLLKIIMVNLQTGLEKDVFSLPLSQEEGMPILESVSISPDGKHFVLGVQKISSDVWLVENFDPDIK
jgi:serine/threonine protein kinase